MVLFPRQWWRFSPFRFSEESPHDGFLEFKYPPMQKPSNLLENSRTLWCVVIGIVYGINKIFFMMSQIRFNKVFDYGSNPDGQNVVYKVVAVNFNRYTFP